MDVSREAYDTFEMTGFTDLKNVHREMSFISLKNLEQIGAGSDSTVYRIDEENVIKVIKSDMSL